jgi:hypothetical protein
MVSRHILQLWDTSGLGNKMQRQRCEGEERSKKEAEMMGIGAGYADNNLAGVTTQDGNIAHIPEVTRLTFSSRTGESSSPAHRS